ncbi:MAG: TetR/AcrR family transcriptional regulator, partial [Chloroflexi bacterium]|nr:TetR/AcrR family transcriptional regulator [Chloroflexota bacterium]
MTDDRTPQERRQARTREAILTAARALIRENGADKLSLRAIARRIDYSPAGLYEYFDSKDDIILTLCERGEEQLTAYLQRVPSDLPFAERVPAMVAAYVDFARDNPEFFQLLFSVRTLDESDPKGFYAYPESSFGVLYGMIEEALAAGEIVEQDGYGAFEIAYSLWS